MKTSDLICQLTEAAHAGRTVTIISDGDEVFAINKVYMDDKNPFVYIETRRLMMEDAAGYVADTIGDLGSLFTYFSDGSPVPTDDEIPAWFAC